MEKPGIIQKLEERDEIFSIAKINGQISNFDKFIEGEKFEVDSLNELFHSYIEEKFDSNKL